VRRRRPVQTRRPVRWIRGSIRSGRLTPAMDSGIHLGNRVWIRASIGRVSVLNAMDPRIHLDGGCPVGWRGAVIAPRFVITSLGGARTLKVHSFTRGERIPSFI
jgi:hypothetical protein